MRPSSTQLAGFWNPTSERSLKALALAQLLLGHKLEVSTRIHAKTSQLVGGDGDSSISVDYDIKAILGRRRTHDLSMLPVPKSEIVTATDTDSPETSCSVATYVAGTIADELGRGEPLGATPVAPRAVIETVGHCRNCPDLTHNPEAVRQTRRTGGTARIESYGCLQCLTCVEGGRDAWGKRPGRRGWRYPRGELARWPDECYGVCELSGIV